MSPELKALYKKLTASMDKVRPRKAPSDPRRPPHHNHPLGYIGGETCEGCRRERGQSTLAEVKQDWAPYR